MAKVTARVPATTANLGPGFDCLGMAVKLYNHIEMHDVGDQPLTIHVSGPSANDSIPLDADNLVYRAANKVFEAAGQRPERLTLKLTLEAPLARGLGSSASAIAGGMAAANALLGSPLDEQKLLSLMLNMEGHPDNITPCLVGGLTASLAIDGKVTYLRRKPSSSIQCVLLVPDYELATAKARQAIPKSIPVKDAVFNLCRVPFVLDRLESGEIDDLAVIIDDQLHQPYRKPLIKAYDEVSTQAFDAGAAAVCISGAGPTILAISRREKSGAVATAMEEALEAIDVQGKAHVLDPDLEGIVIS